MCTSPVPPSQDAPSQDAPLPTMDESYFCPRLEKLQQQHEQRATIARRATHAAPQEDLGWDESPRKAAASEQLADPGAELSAAKPLDSASSADSGQSPAYFAQTVSGCRSADHRMSVAVKTKLPSAFDGDSQSACGSDHSGNCLVNGNVTQNRPQGSEVNVFELSSSVHWRNEVSNKHCNCAGSTAVRVGSKATPPRPAVFAVADTAAARIAADSDDRFSAASSPSSKVWVYAFEATPFNQGWSGGMHLYHIIPRTSSPQCSVRLYYGDPRSVLPQRP